MTTGFTSSEEARRTAKWFVVDADGVVLGRLASEVARIIRGKHKPTYSPHTDCGDSVIVINAEKVVLTGNKLDDKTYVKHTLFLGNSKSCNARDLLQRTPERLIEFAVHGMLPKSTLGKQLQKKLRVVAGAKHRYAAQRPEKLEIKAKSRARRAQAAE